MKTLGIYCAGGLGREVLDLAKRIQAKSSKWEYICFIDDNPTNKIINNTIVYTFEEILIKYTPDTFEVIIASGEPYIRELLYNKVANYNFSLAVLIDPTSSISDFSEISAGVVIFPWCTIGPNTQIGQNTIIHSGSFLGHDDIIGKHCMLCPSVKISGEVKVGNNVFFGNSCVIKNGIYIGTYAIVGIGAVAIIDIEDEWVLMGNPARRIRMNEKKRALS